LAPESLKLFTAGRGRSHVVPNPKIARKACDDDAPHGGVARGPRRPWFQILFPAPGAAGRIPPTPARLDSQNPSARWNFHKQ